MSWSFANNIGTLLAKQRPKTFSIKYSPVYTSLILHHIATDSSHPLHEAQKRRQREWRKEGLWWYATTGVDLSKSGCVRTWARRRLRNAVGDELKLRGYDETGKLVKRDAIQQRRDLDDMLFKNKALDLSGSLRLHAQPSLISAKYSDIRAEVGQVIELLLQGVKNAASPRQQQQQKKKKKNRP